MLELEQGDPPAIKDLAARVGWSAAHFSRAFAAALGQPAAAYSWRIRLDHAASRMLFDSAPIGEIARLFGFDSQAAFNRAFRRQHGAAPRTFVAALRLARPLVETPAIDPALTAEAGLDTIELPGDIYAEIAGCATPADVAAAIGFLYRACLPIHPGFAPEGGPMVHCRGEGDGPGFTATIRLRRLPDAPEWNLMPLDARLRSLATR